MHLDICSDFNSELGRNGLKTKFTDVIFARLECLMCMWLNDAELIEFKSICKIVECSDDMLGSELFPPFGMDNASVLPGGVSTETRIGLIQADQFDIKMAVRFNIKNMVSARKFDGKLYTKPWSYRAPPNAISSACKHIDQVVLTLTIIIPMSKIFRLKNYPKICFRLSMERTTTQLCLSS